MSSVRVAATAAALSLLGLAPGAFAQGPAPAQPAAESFQLGAFKVTALRDAGFALPNNGKVFGLGVDPAETGKVLAAAGAPTDHIALSVDALLVRTPRRVVLLDTGLGPNAHGVLMQSLASAGVSPAQVTDVLITHSHGDHIGGLVDANGKPAFPKAVVHMSAKEWAYLQANSQPQSKAEVAVIAPQVRTFEPGKPVLPGITPIALYGHTPGHVGYVIVSNGQEMEDIGDTAHSSIISLAKPDWPAGFDGDRPLGAKTRRAELTRLAARHELVFAPHFPYPGVGHIEASGDGFVWKPKPLSSP